MDNSAIEEKRYDFYAFISYSRKNSKAAKWLQREMQNSRFPIKEVSIEQRPPHKTHVCPVFRDKSNLPVDGEHYWSNVKTAIENSRYLIVICSPDSAISEPVEKETKYFLETHNNDYSLIVPVLLAGEIGDDNQSTSLPLSLRKNFIRTRNLPSMKSGSSDGKLRWFDRVNPWMLNDDWIEGLAQVLAYLLQVKVEVARSMILIHLRRKLLVLACFLAIFASLTMMLSYCYWDYTREKSFFYSDYIEEYGVPKGIFPLTKKNAQQRHHCYEFIYQYWLVREVRHIDSSGKPRDHFDTEENGRAAVMKIQYQNDCKRFPLIQFINSKHDIAYVRDYAKVLSPSKDQIDKWKRADVSEAILNALNKSIYPEEVQFSEVAQKVPNIPTIRMFAGDVSDKQYDWDFATGVRPLLEKGIKNCNILYSREGWISEIYFPTPIFISEGIPEISGIHFEHDHIGRVLLQQYLGNDLKCFDKAYTGIAAKKYLYDDITGVRHQEKWEDGNGSAVPNSAGVCYVNRVVNRKTGNIDSETYGDAKNNRCGQSNGVAKIKFAYNNAGTLQQVSFFDLEDKRALVGDGYYHIEYEYDKKFSMTTRTLFYDAQSYDKIKERYFPDGTRDYSIYLDKDNNIIDKENSPI